MKSELSGHAANGAEPTFRCSLLWPLRAMLLIFVVGGNYLFIGTLVFRASGWGTRAIILSGLIFVNCVLVWVARWMAVEVTVGAEHLEIRASPFRTRRIPWRSMRSVQITHDSLAWSLGFMRSVQFNKWEGSDFHLAARISFAMATRNSIPVRFRSSRMASRREKDELARLRNELLENQGQRGSPD